MKSTPYWTLKQHRPLVEELANVALEPGKPGNISEPLSMLLYDYVRDTYANDDCSWRMELSLSINLCRVISKHPSMAGLMCVVHKNLEDSGSTDANMLLRKKVLSMVPAREWCLAEHCQTIDAVSAVKDKNEPAIFPETPAFYLLSDFVVLSRKGCPIRDVSPALSFHISRTIQESKIFAKRVALLSRQLAERDTNFTHYQAYQSFCYDTATFQRQPHDIVFN